MGGCTIWLYRASAGYRYTTLAAVPQRPVAVVFGNRTYPGGGISRIFRGRLELALRLFRAGKVEVILVSGDHGSRPGYNEVDPARNWLIARGVPASRVVGDHAGFDSYDTCVRAVRVFGVRRAILVSQAYHLPRAVAVCRAVGIDAVGVAAEAPGVPALDMRRRRARDALAAPKAVFELLLRPEPQRLGEPERGVTDGLSGG